MKSKIRPVRRTPGPIVNIKQEGSVVFRAQLVAVLFCAGAAFAQQITSVEKLPAVVRGFDSSSVRGSMPCTVEPVKPVLNLAFRFQTGYKVQISLDPYVGARHHWYIAFRVTPDAAGHPPVYFLDSIDLPAPSQHNFVADESGAFLVGEGRYKIKWFLIDDLGGFCRQEWSIDAHPSGGLSMKIAMPPGDVGDLAWRPEANKTVPRAKPGRVTILLNVALPAVHAASSSDQWQALLDILTSLLERMPGAIVRLVVFNLDQQRELFREDGFTSGGMNEISHVTDGMEEWAVNYRVLLKPGGGWSLLSDLESKEIHATPKPDAVVFLGLPEVGSEKIPAGMPTQVSGRAPRFFNLEYRLVSPIVSEPGLDPKTVGGAQGVGGHTIDGGHYGFPCEPGGARDGRMSGGIPCIASSGADEIDLIDQSVRRLKGKTIVFASPAALAKAIDTITR